jgi:hypothetical protein
MSETHNMNHLAIVSGWPGAIYNLIFNTSDPIAIALTLLSVIFMPIFIKGMDLAYREYVRRKDIKK